MNPESNHFAVILAGGRGERFWPLSRRAMPKQFLPIGGRQTMLQQTYRRIRPLFHPQNILVLTNAQHIGVARKQLPEVPAGNVIGEPVGRDTALAIALAAGIVGKRSRDTGAVMAVLPADAVIHNEEKFRHALAAALVVAKRRRPNGLLVTFGIQPAFPHTGYGYIQVGERLRSLEGDLRGVKIPFFHARKFAEKPDLKTARGYLRRGNFLWNSGMFVWSFETIADALAANHEALSEALWSIFESYGTPRFKAVLRRVYQGAQKISIDYALMEQAQNVAVAKADFDWDDVGTWAALQRHLPCDKQGNAVRGAAALLGAHDCVVVADSKRLIAMVGVENLVVVQTKDATLVCRKDRAQDVKKLVELLEKSPRRRTYL